MNLSVKNTAEMKIETRAIASSLPKSVYDYWVLVDV